MTNTATATATDRRNLEALVRRRLRKGDSVESAARYAAEHYYGLVTCGPYMPTVRALAIRVAATSAA